MALTQMQLIQSLGEAMAWFERERSWGVEPTKLSHLCGRIGELYVALITNGQMATATNQVGYDVVSATGEYISVKTTAQMKDNAQFSFNKNTFDRVNRVILIRINSEEMQVEVVLDVSAEEAKKLIKVDKSGKRTFRLTGKKCAGRLKEDIQVVSHADYDGATVRELETGTIEVAIGGTPTSPVRPALRSLAMKLNVSLINANGNELNTRQLGTRVIRSIKELKRKDVN